MLCLDVSPEEALQLGFPFHAPGKGALQRLGERASGIHRVGVDREAGILSREPRFGLRKTQLVADKVETVGRIGAVKDGE